MLAVWRRSLGGLGARSRSRARSAAVLDEATDCSRSDFTEMPSDLTLSSSPSTVPALAGGDGGGCGGGGLGGRSASGVDGRGTSGERVTGE